jgi:hypothetical protein
MVEQQRQFVIEWLEREKWVDVCSEAFHDEFAARFGGVRVPKLWGAQPVKKAQVLLAQMWRDGILTRTRIAIADPPAGFGLWVYQYSLKAGKDNRTW